MEYIILWFTISVVALIVDVSTSSFFFGGFTVGGIFALIAQILNADIKLQIIIFVIVSIVAILVEYLVFRRKLKKSIPKTLKMEEEYIGRKITLEEDINERGRVKLEGIYWTIDNIGEPLKKGDRAEIVGIKGNKLIIKK